MTLVESAVPRAKRDASIAGPAMGEHDTAIFPFPDGRTHTKRPPSPRTTVPSALPLRYNRPIRSQRAEVRVHRSQGRVGAGREHISRPRAGATIGFERRGLGQGWSGQPGGSC